MNQLVKELIRPLLENNQKVTAVYGGGFKPPIKGHFGLVQTALKDLPEIDEDTGEEFEVWINGTNCEYGLSNACKSIIKLNKGDIILEI